MENLNQEKLPPQDIEAEKALLGSLMLDKDAIWKIIDYITPEDFYKEAHQIIYKSALDLAQKREPIDIKTISARLKEIGKLEESGGYSYLVELLNTVPTASNITSYANIVQKKRILRDLISASYEINQLGYEEEKDVEEVLDKAEQVIFQIAQKGTVYQFEKIKDILPPIFESLSQRVETGKISGVKTGFSNLDNILAGLHNSDLIILAARPSFGKSAFALQIALNVAVEQEKPVAIFSLEMSKEQVAERLLSMQSKIDLWKIRQGKLSLKEELDEFEILNNALDKLASSPIFIDDTPSPTVLKIKAMARRLQAEQDLGLIVIDYLQLMQATNPKESIVQQISKISRGLKELAKELNVPVLAISQLSRAVEQRHPPIPRLSDLRESGSIEQDADVVLFINRPDRYDESAEPNLAEIIVAKHRNGPLGKVKLKFIPDTVSFEVPAEESLIKEEEEVLRGIEEIEF